jgi:Tfp pilus assembly protein PilF
MKTPLLLPAVLFLALGCSSSPPPPAESGDPEGSGAGEPTGAQPVAPASNELVKEGRDLLESDKFDKAKKVLTDARRKDPKDPQAAYYLGVACQGLGDLPSAQKQYEEALALEPKLSEASLNLSQIKLDAGDAKGALAVIDAALKSDPKHADLLLNRAVSLEKAGGEKAEIIKAYGAAVEARPGDPMLRAVYGGLLSESGKGAEAVVQLKQALNAEDPALLVSVATVLTKEGAYDDCIKAVDRAMLKKKLPALYVRRGICRDGKKDDAGAVSDYEAALAMDPNFAPAHFYYGLNLSLKDKAKALEHIDKAIALAPDNPLTPEAKKKAAELRAGGAPKPSASKPKK